jgi:hypothetical protein
MVLPNEIIKRLITAGPNPFASDSARFDKDIADPLVSGELTSRVMAFIPGEGIMAVKPVMTDRISGTIILGLLTPACDG